MGDVYESFSFGDRTLTGKVFGDLTIDFCKTMLGDAVSQTGMTLTELGVGKYVIKNPNVTERTVCSGYLTSDSTKSFSVMFDPVDGDIATQTSVTAIPTATAIRTEMDSNSTKLVNLDTTISSRASASNLTTAIQHLVDIKGVGWTTETLKAVMALLEDVDAEVDVIHAAVELLQTMEGSELVTVTVTDMAGDPVPEVKLTVRSTGGAFMGVVETDVNGQATFSRDNGTYRVYPSKIAHSFDLYTTLTVSGTTALAISCTAFEPTAPPDAFTQTLFGYVYDINGNPLDDISVRVGVGEQTVINGYILAKLQRSTTTDATGYFEITVAKGATIDVTIEGHYSKTFTVTSDAAKNIDEY